MKRTTTFLFLCLSILFVQTANVMGQTPRSKVSAEERLLKLDSIVISDFTRYEYSYNQQRQLIGEKFFVATDSVNMMFALMRLIEHNYENGKKISSVNSYRFGGNMKASDRTVYEYKEDLLSVERHEYYSNNQWACDRKSEYFYTTDKLISRIEYSVFINGNFSLTEQAEYSYDNQSKVLLSIVRKLLVSGNRWSDKNKTEFNYDAGNLIAQTYFSWNDTINSWKASVKKEFIYNGTNNNEVTYKESNFSNNAFVITLQKAITLDSTCPTVNLVLPYENNLPFKVDTENNVSSRKSSRYYYSQLTQTGIGGLYDSNSLALYPNPAKDILNVLIPFCSSYKIEIYDLSAKPIYLSTEKQLTQLNSLQTINTSSFPKGVCILRIKTDNKTFSEEIIIK